MVAAPTARPVRSPREVPCNKAQAKSWLEVFLACMLWNKAQQPPHEACS